MASAFRTPEGYAATLLHELAHASAAPSRLGRDLTGRFGGRAHAFEELIADLTSCFVGTVLGLSCEVENHASYLQSWLEVLCEDRRAVFRAAAAAQKAADWMLALHPDFAQAVVSADDDQDNGTSAESPAAAVVPEGTPDLAPASSGHR